MVINSLFFCTLENCSGPNVHNTSNSYDVYNILFLLLEAMQKLYKFLKASEIEDLISMVLKFAPHRHLKW